MTTHLADDVVQVGKSRLWPRELTARRLGVVARTLRRWEVERIGPPCIRLGREAYYEEGSIEAWITRAVKRAEAAAE